MSARHPAQRLRRAVQNGNLALVRRLLHPPSSSSGSTVDVRNPDPSNGLTSLSYAAIGGYEDLFEYLVFEEGHDDDELSRDSDNNTILHLLASLPSASLTPPSRQGAFTSGELAVQLAGAYYDRFSFVLDWSNTQGRTALHVAAQEGKDLFVNLLLDLGADIDLPDVFGNTPLHYASAWNHLPVCQTLINRGCRFRERNNDGFTAGDFAYSMTLQTALTTLARAQFDSRKLNKRTHTGLTSSSSTSAPSADEYRAMQAPGFDEEGVGEDSEEDEEDYAGSASGSGGGSYWSAGGTSGLAGRPPDLAPTAPLSLSVSGRKLEPATPPPPPTPPKALALPLITTALSALSIAPSPTRTGSLDQGLPQQPPSPAPSSPSTSSSRFHFHRPHRRQPPPLTTASIGPPSLATPPPSRPPAEPLRLRSSSLSTTVSTAEAPSTISSQSRTSSNGPGGGGSYATSSRASASASGSGGKRGKSGKSKELGTRKRDKWAGLMGGVSSSSSGGGGGGGKLVPPPNLAAKTSRWGK